MIEHDVRQRSTEWYKLRLGKPTASQFSRLVTEIKCEPSEKKRDYRNELLAERFLGRDGMKQYTNAAMEHGVRYEDEAAQEFADYLGVDVVPCGFITDDTKRYGCSLDRRIVGRPREAVEIKCPQPATLFGYVVDGLDKKQYRAQVQGQLMIAELDVVHFFAYHPHPDAPSFHVETRRDEDFIAKMKPIIEAFCVELDEIERDIRRMDLPGSNR
jgi:putative phage-type endonuclease